MSRVKDHCRTSLHSTAFREQFVGQAEQSFPVEKIAAIGGVLRCFSAFSGRSEYLINTELLGACCPCGDRNCSLFIQLHLVQLNSCCAWMDWRKSNWKHLEQSKGLPFFWN